jgi:glycerophosphoryl diester phosphodiesterase
MHDDFLDRTTDGTGLVSHSALEEIRRLDAGSWFDRKFAGERVPTLAEAVEHARTIGIGLVVEIKEFQDIGRLVARLEKVIEETGANDQAIFISFDHVVLRDLKERLPGIRTEGIVHARHADVAAVARAANLDSVSIEHMMFQPEDGEALHKAGVAVRCHFQRPDEHSRYAKSGLDLLAAPRRWIAAGVIDTVSGDDVAYLADLVRQSTRPAERTEAA